MRTNPKGDIVLRQELKEKGVAANLIDEALKQKADTCDEYSIALAMAREQFDRLKKLDRRKAAKRVWDFLARRGFGYEIVKKTIDELIKT